MVSIPLANFEPDKSRFNGGVLPNILNALPTAEGWGPFKSGVTIDIYDVAIGDQSLNNIVDENGNAIVTAIVIGNIMTDDLGYVLTDETPNTLIESYTTAGSGGSEALPTDCTGLFAARKDDGTERIFAGTATKLYEFDKTAFSWSDITRLAGGNYASPGRWSFIKFGSVVYAANGFDAEQKIDIETGLNFTANTTAPVSKYLAVVGDFAFRGNILTFPYQIQWSAINNPQSNTSTIDFSDYQDMPIGDEVMGIVPLTSGAHVWMRSALHNMAFALGSEYVFTRQTLTEMRGTSAPTSIASIAQDDYVVYCDDGFWRFTGGSFNPIGAQRVNAWFLDECDQDARSDILAMPDPENQIVWFAYTSVDGTRKMLGYQYILDRWCLASVSLQASTRARTFAYSGLDVAGVTTDLLRFVVVDSAGRLSYLVGDNLAATIQTNEFSNDISFFVNSGMLQGDPVNYTVTQQVSNYRGGAFTSKAAITPSARTKSLSLRGDGRVHKFTIIIPAAETWTSITSMEISGVPGGTS